MEDLEVCTYRPTMKYNYVLDKPDVGRQKIPLCRLPSLEFTYGYPNPKPEDSAKEALFNWYKRDKSKETRDNNIESEHGDRKFRYERIKLNKVPDVTFGDKSGVSEDFKAIICNGYQHLLVDKMKQREAIRREKIRQKEERLASRRKVIIRVAQTERTFEDPRSLWKMKKFADVESKVSTWRNKDNN